LWSRADNEKLFLNLAEYLAGCSDLKVVKAKCKSTLTAGKSARFKAKVQNLEDCYSRASSLSFYLSEDRVLDVPKALKSRNNKQRRVKKAGDLLLGEVSIPELPGKRQKWLKAKLKLGAGVSPGSYFLLAVINAAGDPLEVNSENNVGSKKVTVE
jgi:hypothetical protein